MSAPDTNIDKQTKRHAGPLVGIALAVVVAVAALAWWALAAGDADYQATTVDATEPDATSEAVGEPAPTTGTGGTEVPPAATDSDSTVAPAD